MQSNLVGLGDGGAGSGPVIEGDEGDGDAGSGLVIEGDAPGSYSRVKMKYFQQLQQRAQQETSKQQCAGARRSDPMAVPLGAGEGPETAPAGRKQKGRRGLPLLNRGYCTPDPIKFDLKNPLTQASSSYVDNPTASSHHEMDPVPTAHPQFESQYKSSKHKVPARPQPHRLSGGRGMGSPQPHRLNGGRGILLGSSSGSRGSWGLLKPQHGAGADNDGDDEYKIRVDAEDDDDDDYQHQGGVDDEDEIETIVGSPMRSPSLRSMMSTHSILSPRKGGTPKIDEEVTNSPFGSKSDRSSGFLPLNLATGQKGSFSYMTPPRTPTSLSTPTTPINFGSPGFGAPRYSQSDDEIFAME